MVSQDCGLPDNCKRASTYLANQTNPTHPQYVHSCPFQSKPRYYSEIVLPRSLLLHHKQRVRISCCNRNHQIPSTGRLPSSQLTMRTPSLLKRFTCTEAESRYDGLDFTIYLSNLLSSNLVYSNTSINQSIKLSNHIKPSKHRSINLYLLHVYLSYLSLPLLFFSDAPLVS